MFETADVGCTLFLTVVSQFGQAVQLSKALTASLFFLLAFFALLLVHKCKRSGQTPTGPSRKPGQSQQGQGLTQVSAALERRCQEMPGLEDGGRAGCSHGNALASNEGGGL